jgi:hypothetical protein
LVTEKLVVFVKKSDPRRARPHAETDYMNGERSDPRSLGFT